jgi:hypothetical protein
MVRFGVSSILGISPSSLPAALMSRFRIGVLKIATVLRIANGRRSCRAGGCLERLSFDHVGRLPVWRL